MPQQLTPLLSRRASSEASQRKLSLLFIASHSPRTTRESVPNVKEAFLPTESVVGTFSSSACVVALAFSEGSLNGSSSPTEAMVMNGAQTQSALRCKRENEK